MKITCLNLMSTTPIGNSVKILRQWSVPEDLSFFVLGVFRKWKGVVCGGAAEEKEGGIADVFAGFGIGVGFW
jgi:hypothetical protein